MSALCDDILLLLLDDDSGKPVVDGSRRDLAVAGAALSELERSGRVQLVDGRCLVTDTSATGDPVLDIALDRLAAKPLKPVKALQAIAEDCRRATLDALVERGLLRREEVKALLVFRLRSWPAADTTHERQVRDGLEAAMAGGRPDGHTGSLITLLHLVDAIPKVLAGDAKRLRARAAEIVEDAWVPTAVRAAVAEANTLMVAAIITTAG